MRNFIVISLVLCFTFLSVRNAFVFTYFKWNQDYITENFCRNKAVKELKCNGKCRLKDMMKEVEQTDQSLPFPYIPSLKAEDFVYPYESLVPIPVSSYLTTKPSHFADQIKPCRLLVSGVFHPPQPFLI